MATFTITLKEMAQSEGCVIGVDEYKPEWYGLDSYPIYDEGHRSELNRKIIDHFWNREIGQESVPMFRLAMRRKMNEVMPYFNEQYRMSAVTIDPLQTIDIESKGNANSTSHATGTSSSDATSKARTVLSDHPQELLADDGDYATNSNDNISDTATSGNSGSDSTDTNQTDSTTKGSTGHAAALVFQARQAIVNVDMMVISELEGLFFKLWNNGDEFTDSGFGGTFYGYW